MNSNPAVDFRPRRWQHPTRNHICEGWFTAVSARLVLGLDVGGTSTRALAVDATTGARLGAGSAQGANPVAHGVPRAAENIGAALAQALAGHDPAEVRACVVGMAGASKLAADPQTAAAFAELWQKVGLRCEVSIVSDVAAAFAAGTAESRRLGARRRYRRGRRGDGRTGPAPVAGRARLAARRRGIRVLDRSAGRARHPGRGGGVGADDDTRQDRARHLLRPPGAAARAGRRSGPRQVPRLRAHRGRERAAPGGPRRLRGLRPGLRAAGRSDRPAHRHRGRRPPRQCPGSRARAGRARRSCSPAVCCGPGCASSGRCASPWPPPGPRPRSTRPPTAPPGRPGSPHSRCSATIPTPPAPCTHG